MPGLRDKTFTAVGAREPSLIFRLVSAGDDQRAGALIVSQRQQRQQFPVGPPLHDQPRSELVAIVRIPNADKFRALKHRRACAVRVQPPPRRDKRRVL